MIEFGEYLPDVAPLENPGLINCKNILPTSAGYQPFPSAAPASVSTIDARAQGGYSARDQTNLGTVYTIVGTFDKLYSFDATGFTDVSQVGGYSTQADDTWEFVAWGNDIIATNFTDPIQNMTLGSPPFADLGGSPPHARHIATVDNFVVVGNTWDGAADYQPQRVQWSGLNNSATWAVSAVTQADYQDLRNDGGYIQKIIGGEFGLIFQERAITRMSYIGSPLVFQFDQVETNRGALAAESVIKVGPNVYYLGQDGFFMFNGDESIPIGDGKVDNTFFADADITLLTRMSVAQYPNENIVCWSYASLNSTDGIPDTILMYNYSPTSKLKWSYAKIDNWLLLNPISQAYTLDGLDAVSTNLDALPSPPPNDISLDSKVWQGSINLLGLINTDLEMAFLNGSPLPGTIETGEAWLSDPNRTYVTLIRPHVDRCTGTVTAQIAARNLESEAVSYGPVCTINSAGYIPVRANARFMRAQFNITGDYNDAQGFDIITTAPVGRR